MKLSKLSDLRGLEIAKLVLENSDKIFNKWLDDESPFFLDMVEKELCGTNMIIKWDDFILWVEWKWRIFEWIQSSDYPPETQGFIMKMTEKFPEQFDNETVSNSDDFIKILVKLDVDKDTDETDFKTMIDKDDFKERYQEHKH